MLRRLQRKLLPHLTSTPPPTPPPPSRLRSPLPKFVSHRTSSATAFTDPSLTVYFLTNSCGLSLDSALSAAKKIHLKSTRNAHSVLSLLKSFGFTKPHLARFVSARPRLLLASPHETLRPKLDFYRALGLSDPALAHLLSSNPALLCFSLRNRIIPNFELLKSLLGSHVEAVAAIKGSRKLLVTDLSRMLLPKADALRAHGVPMHVVSRLLALRPATFIELSDRFDETVSAVKDMGVDPTSVTFAHAMGVFARLPKPAWERKVQNYRSLGWSYDEVRMAFARHPYFMSVSVEKVRKNMEFFGRRLGWSPAYVSANAVVMSLSFEKRIAPRCAVLGILAEKGLVERGVRARQLMMGEKLFLEKYVNEHRAEAPEVVEAIQGKLGLERLAVAGEKVAQS